MTNDEIQALPPLYESVLGEGELDALFTDLGMLEGPIEISLKRARTERAGDGAISLADARAALRDRSARGVQIRYVHERVAWCDTLLSLQSGTRLVRFAVPTGAP